MMMPTKILIEIDLENINFAITGNFVVNHGIANSSSIYPYNNSNVILYNSGTLIFLNQTDNTPETNYYLEDLNTGIMGADHLF